MNCLNLIFQPRLERFIPLNGTISLRVRHLFTRTVPAVRALYIGISQQMFCLQTPAAKLSVTSFWISEASASFLTQWSAKLVQELHRVREHRCLVTSVNIVSSIKWVPPDPANLAPAPFSAYVLKAFFAVMFCNRFVKLYLDIVASYFCWRGQVCR